MTEHISCTIDQLPGLIEKKIAELRRNVSGALDRTAADSVEHIKSRTPKAFGELQNSVHLVPGANPRTVIDAPHAAAVEKGSAPHRPDIDRLIEWVKLRGMQGLRNVRSPRLHGPTTATQAVRIKELLAKEIQSGTGGKFSPVDAPRKVAEAIAKSIELHGTKPHFFVRSSLPGIAMRLGQNVRRALNK